MKLPVTIVTDHRSVMIDVEPAVYNRAVNGAEHFQSVIVDLMKQQIDDVATDLAWADIEVGEPGSQP
jgi:hypothetical protein